MLCGAWNSGLGSRREWECPAFPKTVLEEFLDSCAKILGFVKGLGENSQLGVPVMNRVNLQRRDNRESEVTLFCVLLLPVFNYLIT